MMMDDDDEGDRWEKLGFRPQKENVYNKLLPYADRLDDESIKLFADIKTNLVKAVLAREMRPGCALWTSRLNKYIKIYGLKFSKEDHIALIKLFYELLTIPDLEPTRINKCATTLNLLLKKKYLISRDELELEWRPLYDLCLRVFESSKSDLGMYRCFSNLEETVISTIRSVRIYFPASATQEILDTFRPKLCPFEGADILIAVDYLEVFLPICVKPEEASISYELWFEEFMTLWNVCHNANSLEDRMMWLMARLSSYSMGYIDWEPYIPLMFDRFSRSLQLPVGYKQKQTGKQRKIDISSMAMWITCCLNGDNNSAFFHVEKFMQSLKSYCYPANLGRWTSKLRKLLRKLSFYFVQRVHCERYKKKSWETEIPIDYKLTDADIDRFVIILKSCLEHAIFCRSGSQDITLTLQYLASIRPNLIIPMILDQLYASMDSLTEPHRLIASMMSCTAVSRYMVVKSDDGTNYSQGFTHCLPLLMALLPGIDPNDIRKCLVTFNFLSHYINMIPLMDSSGASKYYPDLTEEEHVVCEASAMCEDFVLQFFAKLFSWVESNSLDFVRLEQQHAAATNTNGKNRVEVIAETSLVSIISVVLNQCSPEIFTSALKKVYNYVTEKIFEIRISGKMVAIICQGFAKVNPKETLKLFIPHLCDTIEKLLGENANIDKEEHLDAELLYYLQILSEIVDARSELINYFDRLTNILNCTLHMSAINGSQMAGRLLELMMTSLSYTYAIDYRTVSTSYATHVKDFLPIRHWGMAQNINKLNISWYIPKEKEIDLVQTLLNRYLIPELDRMNAFLTNGLILSREERRRSIGIIISILSAHPLLPIWEEPAIQLVDSVLDPWAFNLIVCDAPAVTMPNGDNVRQTIANLMHQVQKKILEIDEGDTKSLQDIVQVYCILLFNKSRGQDFEWHWKNFHIAKKLQEDRLHQNKLHLRQILLDRVMLQQEFRIESRSCSFTETHKQMLLDLFQLSVSRYSEVRIAAQKKVFNIISYFPYSYTVLTSEFRRVLTLDSRENHETFKGCLYLLIGPKSTPIIARHDWSFIAEIWPLLVRSRPSEKPSIVNLISNVNGVIHRHFPTIAINLVFTPQCLAAARILSLNRPTVVDLHGFELVIGMGEENLKRKCDARAVAYSDTVEALLDACINMDLHWRYHSMALCFLKVLVHYDVKYNVDVVKYFLQALINESITVRKTALKVVLFILIQNKPKFRKIPIQLLTKDDVNVRKCPGIRPDNEWLLYDNKTAPRSAVEWDRPRFVHDLSVGYYAWPKPTLEVFAAASEQPNIDKRLDGNLLSDQEREIYQFFDNSDNIDQLIKYFSLEERKGADQFNAFRFLLFKNFFKIFEDKLLHRFQPHLERLATDKHESSQRCAAELISGLIRGSKHWSFTSVERMWTILIPILRTVVQNLCSETTTDWGLCIAMAMESRDPNRHHWLIEFLMDDPLSEHNSSLVACGRLQMLHAALNQMSWRGSGDINRRLLSYFTNYDLLSHSFQNVRDKISSCLTVIFSQDVTFIDTVDESAIKTTVHTLKVKDFFNEIQPTFDHLYEYYMLYKSGDGDENVDKNKNELQQREKMIRQFKLVAKYITSSLVRTNYSTMPEYFGVLPLVCVLQTIDGDDEMQPICTNLLAVMAQSITIRSHMPAALVAIRTVAKCRFWSARACITEFMSCFVFHNMSSLLSNQKWVEEIQSIVLELLEDVQPEVRISSSQVLSGLLHCQFLPNPTELLELFKQKAKTKLKRNKNTNNNNHNSVGTNGAGTITISRRHAGVLGLCAFISSHPYDVPDYLNDIFRELGSHLNDPQPIPAAILKTLGDFKRTHHENWETHKLKFTVDELAVLSDLTVPPSYYA